MRTLILAGVSAVALSFAAPALAAGAPASANPAVAEWAGPYGGVPPFDRTTPDLVRKGFDEALAARRAEIDAIVKNPAAPTFENTIVALERAGAAYERVNALLGIYTSSMADDAWQKVESELSPKQAAAADELIQNEALFRRIDAVWNSPEKAKLTPEQTRLLWRTWDGFVRQGAKVAPEKRARLSQINQELAQLYTDFSQKVLADEETWIVVDSDAQLAGVPDSLKASYKAAAEERGLAGKWAIVNTRSSVDPFLTYGSDRALREKVWTAFKNRGDNADAEDTNALIAKIMPLRQERAKLLGYPTYAHWKLGDKMAGTPERATALLETMWKPTAERIREEVADMQALAKAEGANLTVQPWDYLYYAEKVRKAKYDLDQNELKPYFELNKMIEASHFMAGKLYGLSFKEVTGQTPVFHPDVRVWEVYDGGKLIGLFYGDYFARAGKRSGAWENAYRSQSAYDGRVLPLVSNNNNFVKGAPGEPVLISLDDAETLFHEFGHAIHDLVSNVNYPSVSGTNTSTDFVEFPSQVHENWVLSAEVLDKYGRHYKTGEAMPKALLEKVEKASTFNQGYVTGEYLLTAIVDMKMHMDPTGQIDADAFEKAVLKEIGAPAEVALRHRLPQFTHGFSSDAYAAGYYSYLWSDTMGADAWQAFVETGNVWDPATAKRMKAMMAAGDSVDQSELYKQFRGRDPDVNALLQSRGFAPASK